MNIAKLIKQGEGETLEFKQNFDREGVFISAGAMANRNGGKILIGVTNKGAASGITIGKETLKDWANQISQGTDPKIIVDIGAYKAGEKTVVVIEVPNSNVKPVSVGGKYYLRVANSNRNLPLHKLNEIYMGSVGMSWDAMPAHKALMRDISMKKVKLYMERSLASGRRKFSDPPLQVLKKLGFIVDDRPTWSAILLFGNEPNKFVKHARVHCGRIKGESKIIDDNYIEGDIFEQINKTISVIERNINVEFVITGKKAQRDEVWEYPLDALRESVINAICHRDYMDTNDILIKIYDDRISIWNPGGLPFGMTMDMFKNPDHPSKPRNKNIAQALYDIADIERYGTGVKRILDACRKAGLPNPVFEEMGEGFHVLFRKPESEKLKLAGEREEIYHVLTARQKEIMQHVKLHGKITLSECVKLIPGVSEKTLYRDLQNLVSRKILQPVGEKRGTRYILTQKRLK
ncbi:MAG: putative DNA binding domain-containing protein [Bacteroidetes bacterium]|nr:putative DNA binding domain-containing protein [Bacteroidota bacterium]